MKAFALPERSRLKIVKVTPRKETHGKDLVQAISLRIEWCPTENSALNLLHPGLQDMLFWTPPEVAAQCHLEGVEPVKKHLRVPTAAMPIKIDGSFTGYTFTVEHGIDDSSALELYDSTLDKFDADGEDGGSSSIRWSLASNKTMTPELVGALCALEGMHVIGSLVPPKPKAEPIDGSVEAFERDHPQGDPDATDLFASDGSVDTPGDSLGDPDSDEEADSEGGATDLEERLDNALARGDAAEKPPGTSTRTARGRAATARALAEGAAS